MQSRVFANYWEFGGIRQEIAILIIADLQGSFYTETNDQSVKKTASVCHQGQGHEAGKSTTSEVFRRASLRQ